MNPIFAPIPFKEIDFHYPYQGRVAFFDPSEIYQRQQVHCRSRVQASLKFEKMFPSKDGICACGCGQKLTGRKRKWASEECSDFAVAVWGIIDGRRSTIEFYLKKLNGGWFCSKCGEDNNIKIDHIIPVKHGGGGCWLNNYQLLCHSCHVKKTNEDFGWKQSSKIQLQMAL